MATEVSVHGVTKTNNALPVSCFKIEQNAFYGLTNLSLIRLRHNSLRELTPNMFLGMPQCEYLSIGFNLLTSIQKGAFYGLGNVKEVWLYNNNLTELRPDMFLGLESLQILHIDDNKIAVINADTFIYVPRPLAIAISDPRNYYRDNPFQCDPGMCWLKAEERHGTITWFTLTESGKRYVYQPECENGVDWNRFNCSTSGNLSVLPDRFVPN